MIRFRLRLRAMSFLTIGSGIPDIMGADVVHVRKTVVNGEVTRNVIYIPGSSVKGVLRTNASRIANAYGFKSCIEIDPRRLCALLNESGAGCDVCELFGRPGADPRYSSKLFVSDFTSEEAENNRMLVTRVSLDDRTLTSRRGALYSVEHVLPGTEFTGTLKVEDDGSVGRLLPLLLLAIAELRLKGLGRGGLVDAKVEDNNSLDALVGDEWRPLVEGLRSWLWEGRLGRDARNC